MIILITKIPRNYVKQSLNQENEVKVNGQMTDTKLRKIRHLYTIMKHPGLILSGYKSLILQIFNDTA